MTITLEYKFKDELSDSEIEQMSKLHLKNGLLWPHFKRKKECEVVLAFLKHKIIAWGLVFYNKEVNSNECHIYVSPQYRRLGIGTQIFEIFSDLYVDGLLVSKWSKEAEKFYSNFDEVVD